MENVYTVSNKWAESLSRAAAIQGEDPDSLLKHFIERGVDDVGVFFPDDDGNITLYDGMLCDIGNKYGVLAYSTAENVLYNFCQIIEDVETEDIIKLIRAAAYTIYNEKHSAKAAEDAIVKIVRALARDPEPDDEAEK